MEFSRPEYWSRLPCPYPGDLPNPGIKPRSPTLQADSLQLTHKGSPRILEGFPILSPGYLPNLEIKPGFSALQVDFPRGSDDKAWAYNAGDPGLIPESGRFAGEGISHPLQYSWASLVAQLVKNPPAVQETWV